MRKIKSKWEKGKFDIVQCVCVGEIKLKLERKKERKMTEDASTKDNLGMVCEFRFRAIDKIPLRTVEVSKYRSSVFSSFRKTPMNLSIEDKKKLKKKLTRK